MRESVEYDTNDFNNENDTKGVYAKFYISPLKNETLSAEQGRPVYEDKEFIEILASGNSNNIIRRKASDMDRQRFRAAYAKFKEGDAEQLVGTPLSEVSWVSRSQVEELAYMKCRTVEQLANIMDQACTGVPGLYDLKRKATAWLLKTEGEAPFTALAKENEDLRSELEALKNTVKELAAAHNAKK
jgi:hypothetical protein